MSERNAINVPRKVGRGPLATMLPTAKGGVRLGTNRLHQLAGRTTSGNALTICGRTLKASDPRYIETNPEDVPLGQHCLGCWG